MARLQMIQIEGVDELQSEDAALSASPIACAVADEWLLAEATMRSAEDTLLPRTSLFAALDAIEAATRESPLRKVRP